MCMFLRVPTLQVVFITKIDAVFVVHKLCEHPVYTSLRYIVQLINNVHFRVHRLGRVLLIRIQMLIKEAAKKDRLQQVLNFVLG